MKLLTLSRPKSEEDTMEYHKWFSPALGQEMEFKVYGQGGKPVIVFPSSGGRFYEYEDFGMIEACQDFIQSGQFQFFTPDSVDAQSWLCDHRNPWERSQRHNEYDTYITQELLPYIRSCNPWPGRYLVTGCSMGGYQSSTFYFRHPELFDSLIALSGVYSLRFFVGESLEPSLHLNSPIEYMAHLQDTARLEQYRRAFLVFAAGQGRWEEQTLEDMHRLQEVLAHKQVPAWFDYWGHDVDHDWPWWRKMMPYFLGKYQESR